ncbi:hypothetical protein GCM10023078_17770 [Gibbsiella greigii]
MLLMMISVVQDLPPAATGALVCKLKFGSDDHAPECKDTFRGGGAYNPYGLISFVDVNVHE